MAKKLISKADVISAKSERAKKCVLEMTDVKKKLNKFPTLSHEMRQT